MFSLYRGTIYHARTSPVAHTFTYPAAFIAIDLASLQSAPRSWRFGYNRRAFLSINDCDYLMPNTQSIAAKLGGSVDPARTIMMTMPRGPLPAFNPLTCYFTYDGAGLLTGFAAEVSNTYHERILYAARPVLCDDGSFTAEVPKALYVSPFHGVKGIYQFRGRLDPARAEMTVVLRIDGHAAITASLSGDGGPFAAATFADMAQVAAAGFLAWPRIVAQGLRLRAKGMRPVMKPRPPVTALRARGKRA